MPSSNPDDTLLLIRCPSCGQRFKVGEDLRGRTVECGGCEHRFRINDDVIVRGKKFYPGERKDPTLNRFQRVPLSMAPSTAALPSVRYADAPDPVSFEPAAPQRVVAGVVGVIGMVFMALLLMFGSNRGGVLDGMITQNRLLMAGFTGLLGMILLIYANPKARIKAFLIAFIMTAGLVSLPFVFTAGSVPLANANGAPPQPVSDPEDEKTPEEKNQAAEDKSILALRELIGTRPLEDEMERLATSGSKKQVVGIWLRDLGQQNRLMVRDYFFRTTEAETLPYYFPREKGDFLMLISGITMSLDEVARLAAGVGSIEKIYPEVSVVEVRVNNESFIEGAIEKLTNRNDPAFYDLNKRELESIDLDRVSKAVKRLAEAEPKVYRNDISRKLVQLLSSDWVEFKAEVCEALQVWSETPGAAGDAALKEVKKLMDKNRQVPEEMIALIVKEKNPAVIPILDKLWSEKPVQWESLYAEAGPAAEPGLIQHLATADGALRQSLVRLLGKVGSEQSLPLLEAALPAADAELKVLIEKSSESIRKRVGQ